MTTHSSNIKVGEECKLSLHFDIDSTDPQYSGYSIKLNCSIYNNKWHCPARRVLTEDEYKCIEEVFHTMLNNLYKFNVKHE